MTRFVPLALALSFVIALAGCATPGGGSPNDVEIRTGRIEQITATTMPSNHHQGVGAILGGIAGAGIGSLIGAGTGRDVAIAAGAIAGVVGGTYVQKREFDKPQPAQQIIVRLNSGVLVSITQPVNPALANGMRVYVEGAGSDARVVPAR
jgi:outer membrane lipoprotein SlyB